MGDSADSISGHSLIVGSSSFQTHLFPIHTQPGGQADVFAYCIEMDVTARYNIDLFTGPWSNFPGNNNFDTNPAVREKVAWIVRNSHPQISLEQLAGASGIQGLTAKEAIAGTQAAIWSLTDSAPTSRGFSYKGVVVNNTRLTPGNSEVADRVGNLVSYLTGPANPGRPETTGPALAVSATGGEAGTPIGPIRVDSSENTAKITLDSAYPLVTGDGSPVDLNAAPTNIDLFLDVPADAPAGSAEVSASITGPTSTGLLVYNTQPRTQTLMIALSDNTTLEDSASLAWRAVPEIATSASDGASGGSYLPEDAEASVVDVVTYERLIPGEDYTVSGELMIREPDGSATATGITAERTFTPQETSGTVDLTFAVPAGMLTGSVIVVFERLYRDGAEVAAHADITDEQQTVYRPRIETHAYNLDDPTSSLPHTGGTLQDEVSFFGLEPGQIYTLAGELMDRETGESTGITAEKSFTPESSRGTVAVDFAVPSDLAGRTLVVFERLHLGADGKVIATHEDIDDERQTVAVEKPPTPEIRTTARDKADGDDYLAPTGEVTIVDTVEYTDLLVGKEYTISGELMIKDAEGATHEASGITASRTFTPEEPSGAIDLEFTVPDGTLSGSVIVVFERLHLGGKVVATHTEIDDRDQTVFRPHIETDAYNPDDPDAPLPYTGGILQDQVAYAGLEPGETYRISGELMVSGTGEPTGITAETTFTPEAPAGTVTVDFQVPGDFHGTTLVVFERLHLGDTLLAAHEDIDDERQTVAVEEPPTPKIRTNAADRDTGGSFLPPSGEATVVDTVTYEGLMVGKEYTVSGELMLRGADGAGEPTGITAETTFTPSAESGAVDLEFTVPEGMLHGSVIVVFEHLFLDGVEVAAHADLTDEAQTVYRPQIDTFAYELLTKGKILPTEGGTLRDEVSYEGLRIGETYTVRGEVMLHDTGETTGITAETTFTAESESGTVFVDFEVPEGYASRTLVVFERLYLSPDAAPPATTLFMRMLAPSDAETLLAVHEDLDDEKQTTTVADVPVIGTTARDREDGDSYLSPTGESVVVDTVRYTGLTPGWEYTIAGELMIRDQEGEPEPTGITAERTFTPQEASGEIELEFTIPAGMHTGAVIVVFERLFLGEVEVAAHADIDDADQTVFRPHVETDAYNLDDPQADLPHTGGTLQDQVAYAGLEVGETYRVTGELIDRDTGEATGITGETTFTAETQDGVVLVDFTVTDEFAGRTLVVFERLFLGDLLLAAHEDLTDERQTVAVEEPPAPPADPPTVLPPPDMPVTGVGTPLGLLGISLLAVGAGAVLLVRRFRF